MLQPTSTCAQAGSQVGCLKRSASARLAAECIVVGSAGWKIGSVADFLELSPEEASFIEMKLSLARNLRLRRQRRKLTQTQLAKLLNSSQSRVAKMEAADASVSLDLLIRPVLSRPRSSVEWPNATGKDQVPSVVARQPLPSLPTASRRTRGAVLPHPPHHH